MNHGIGGASAEAMPRASRGLEKVIEQPQREVTRAVSQLSDEIRRLDNLIDELSAHISPILSPGCPPPTNGRGDKAERGYSTDLGCAVNDRRLAISGINERMEGIVARIEL